MNKQDIYRLLAEKGVSHEIFEHEAVYTIEGMINLGLPGFERVAKNLFLRDDKKNFYLLTVKEDRKINLKEVAAKIGSRRLSFASEAYLEQILQLISGAVTPLGVLNDSEKQVNVYFDSEYLHRQIGIHPLDNTATVFMETDDLVDIITPHCKKLEFVDFE